jgi:hypothetical protein
MNERIRELAEQAERLAEDELAHLERVHNRLYSFTEGREIYNQKFAELIVRECAELVKDFYQEDEFTCYSAKTEIKEHFGVEE